MTDFGGMGGELAVFVFSLALAALASKLVKASIRKPHDGYKVLESIADTRGGVVVRPVRGLFSTTPATLECDGERARLRIEVNDATRGNMTKPWATVQTHFALPAGPGFSVRPEGVGAWLDKRLGGQDVVLGQSIEFDKRFIVKCDDVRATSLAWNQNATELMLKHFGGASLRSDGNLVTLEFNHAHPGSWLINKAIELVTELVSADSFGTKELQQLPNAVRVPPSGTWGNRTPPAVLLELGSSVLLSPTMRGQQPVTRAKVSDIPADVNFAVSIEQGQFTSAPQFEFETYTMALVREAGRGTLACADGLATFTWPHIERDPSRLLAGAKLVASLIGQPSSAYR